MPRFFIDSAPENGIVRITGEDAHHIARVLRMKPGEELTACDGAGTDYLCAFEGLEDGAAVCRVEGQEPSRGEPTVRATLFMALPKSDKMDLIVQKATELGVSAIVPFVGARCVSKPDERSMGKKLQRWQKIVREAAMQCGRGVIPVVQPCVSFKQAVQMAVFRNVIDPGRNDILRLHAVDVFAVQDDLPAQDLVAAEDRRDQLRASGSDYARNTQDLARIHFE